MISVQDWPTVALITDQTRPLTSAVQLSNFPTSKFAPSDHWDDFVHLFRNGQQSLPQVWADLFGPLRKGAVDDLVSWVSSANRWTVGSRRLPGHSKYINCRPASSIFIGCVRWLTSSSSVLERP